MSDEASPKDSSDEFQRGRPGRRSAAERREVVMALLSGKATVPQLARKYGVLPSTVENWHAAALIAVEQAMQVGSGSGASARERELEQELDDTKAALARVSVERALAMQAVEEWKKTGRPTRPARSRR